MEEDQKFLVLSEIINDLWGQVEDLCGLLRISKPITTPEMTIRTDASMPR